MIWEHNILFDKARFYILKAESLKNDDAIRPLFYSFTIELLCKAALSFIHPSLIADPQDEGQSLMYSLGLPHRGQPKSLPAHSIFKRVQQLVEPFLDSHLNFCEYFSSKRNEELHSGESPMSSMKDNEWLPKFYTVANILCLSMNKELRDLIGDAATEHALELITTTDKNEEDSIRKKIGNHKAVFLAKSDSEKLELQKIAKQYVISNESFNTKSVQCPSCNSEALIHGREVQQKEPMFNNEEFYTEVIYQTNHLTCKACGIELKNQREILVANVEIRFAKLEGLDLHDFYHSEEYPEYDNM